MINAVHMICQCFAFTRHQFLCTAGAALGFPAAAPTMSSTASDNGAAVASSASGRVSRLSRNRTEALDEAGMVHSVYWFVLFFGASSLSIFAAAGVNFILIANLAQFRKL